MDDLMPVLQEPGTKRKINKKLLMVLILLFLIILAVLFFNSSISKISEIKISGAVFSSNSEIVTASGIETGDSFFKDSVKTIEVRIKTLNEISTVQVSKKFPGVITISVVEHPAVAFELQGDGTIYAMLANGEAVEADGVSELLLDKPVLTGWEKEDPLKKELALQLAQIPAKQLADLSEILPIPSTAYPDRIRMYTRTKFEVITAVSVLSEKIDALNAVIETQEPGKITMLLADTYVPFDSEGENSVQSN